MSELFISRTGIFDLLPIEFDPFPRKLRGCGLYADPCANYSTMETDEDHFIRVALPGHSNETVKVEAEGNRLTITALNLTEGFDAELIEDQEFKFRIPNDCNIDRIEGSVHNGILSIMIPKSKEKSIAEKIIIELGD